MSYDALFSPIKIRGLELKNRVVMPGMNTKMVRDKHFVDENLIAYHVARAKAGCALNITEVAAVCPAPHAYMYFGIYTDEDVRQWRKLTDAVHAAGGKMGVQLWHGGFTPQYFFDKTNALETPDTCSIERLQEIEKEFGAAAGRAVQAGFDVIELHAAHSYLPHEMLSPGMNHRTDAYGGSFENRSRFLFETIKEIRTNMPEDMPLFMRLDCVDEMMPQTMPEEEIVEVINRAADLGVDVADLSRGNSISFATVYEVPPYQIPHGFNVENIYKIKKQVRIPVMGVGRITTPELANKVIKDGKFDLVAIGRGQLADAQWVQKAREGRSDAIRQCIGCTQGCYDAVINPKFRTITCTRNPLVGLEYKGLQKAAQPKKVLIVGGGMGGMMAAEILQERGHMPILYEASDKLGGKFPYAGMAPGKQDFADAAAWEAKEITRRGIEVHLRTKVTPELLEREKPDAVILATGSKYVAPSLEGMDSPCVTNQLKVLSGEVKPEGNVCVIGCGAIGSEVAQILAARGCRVTVLEKKGVGNGLAMLRKMFLKPTFKQMNIASYGGVHTLEIHDRTVHFIRTDKKTQQTEEKTLDVDSVVICFGIEAEGCEDLQRKCEELGIPKYVIGDAKQPRNALWATREACEAAMEL